MTPAAVWRIASFAGVSGFQRPDDGSWDPSDPRVFYFVTTAAFESKSRLWRLTFADPPNPLVLQVPPGKFGE